MSKTLSFLSVVRLVMTQRVQTGFHCFELCIETISLGDSTSTNSIYLRTLSLIQALNVHVQNTFFLERGTSGHDAMDANGFSLFRTMQ
jgi:hypothetical protein